MPIYTLPYELELQKLINHVLKIVVLSEFTMSRLMIFVACGFLLQTLLMLQAEGQSCYSGDLPNEDLETLAINCTKESCEENNNRGYVYFFTNLNISCNGTLTNWTVAGRLSVRSIASNPSLIVWRINPNNPSEYLILHKTPLLTCSNQTVTPNSNGLYSCELLEGLPVQEGDVVGMEIPYYGSETTRFFPYFNNRSSNSLPPVRYFTGTTLSNFIESQSESTNLLPLLSVNVQLEDSSNDMATTTAITTAISKILDATLETTTIGLKTLIIIVGAAAALLAALLLLLAIQCCVTIRIRNKSKTSHCHRRIETDSPPAEPYTIVEMNATSKTVPKLQRKTDAIELSENPSYCNAMPYAIVDVNAISKTDPKLQQKTDAMQLSKNPSYSSNIFMLAGDGHENKPQSLEDYRLGLSHSHSGPEEIAILPADITESSPVRNSTAYSYQSVHSFTNEDNDGYTKVGEMTAEEGLDENHFYHQPFTTNYIRT